jgi:hypothetical protein
MHGAGSFQRTGVSPNQLDVLDGDPSELVLLAPDDDGRRANTYTVKDIYAQGRTIAIRCHFGKEAIDVKLANPVAACRHSGGNGRAQITCRYAQRR